MDVIGKAASAGEETLDAGGYRGDLSVRVCAGIFRIRISRSIAHRSTLSAGHGL
jgi:hypothetical protein